MPDGCCGACATSPGGGASEVDATVADAALNRMEVDGLGLDAMDRRYST